MNQNEMSNQDFKSFEHVDMGASNLFSPNIDYDRKNDELLYSDNPIGFFGKLMSTFDEDPNESLYHKMDNVGIVKDGFKSEHYNSSKFKRWNTIPTSDILDPILLWGRVSLLGAVGMGLVLRESTRKPQKASDGVVSEIFDPVRHLDIKQIYKSDAIIKKIASRKKGYVNYKTFTSNVPEESGVEDIIRHPKSSLRKNDILQGDTDGETSQFIDNTEKSFLTTIVRKKTPKVRLKLEKIIGETEVEKSAEKDDAIIAWDILEGKITEKTKVHQNILNIVKKDFLGDKIDKTNKINELSQSQTPLQAAKDTNAKLVSLFSKLKKLKPSTRHRLKSKSIYSYSSSFLTDIPTRRAMYRSLDSFNNDGHLHVPEESSSTQLNSCSTSPSSKLESIRTHSSTIISRTSSPDSSLPSRDHKGSIRKKEFLLMMDNQKKEKDSSGKNQRESDPDKEHVHSIRSDVYQNLQRRSFNDDYEKNEIKKKLNCVN